MSAKDEIEVFDLSVKRKAEIPYNAGQLVEAAYRVCTIAHGESVRLVATTADMDVVVHARYARYMLSYDEDLSLSIYLAGLRQALLDLIGRDGEWR